MSRDDIPQAARHWDERYRSEGRLWGDGPSELARLTVARLRPYATPELRILDVGCGYGRDTRYLAAELGCRVLGLDPSPAAVTTARTRRSSSLDVDFVASDLVDYAAKLGDDGRFDVVYSCNVYHLLGPVGRREFAAALGAPARPGGLHFLSTRSPRDAQHYAKGRQVLGEERSWVDKVYLHFSSAKELQTELGDFDLLDVDERSYEEQNPGGVHHHTSWFVEGRRR